MADNGTTKGSMMAAIQSAQMAVGSALKGGAAAVSSPADLEQVSVLESIKEFGKDTKDAVESMANTMAETLAFDKDKFRREMDMAREAEKERLKLALANRDNKLNLPTKEEATGGFGKLGMAGIVAVAAFAEALNVDAILRLPQQLKSIRAMANFAKGVGTIATLGFGPKIISSLRAFFNSFDLKAIRGRFAGLFRPLIDKFDNFKSNLTGKGSPFARLQIAVTSFFRSIGNSVRGLVALIRENKALKFITASVTSAFRTIRATLQPIINTIRGFFRAGSGVISKILGPLRVLGRTIGRLFLPITLVLGVIDGVKGFMEEFGETGSILDGIRGAVTGIVDGFIGGLVRLIGDAIEAILSFCGLDNLGAAINEKINELMDSFLLAVGGIVDLVTGLFSFDGERIMKGLGAMFSGVGGFFLNLLTVPIDLAVNFLKDIFGFGDPDEPFSLKKWLFGGDGEKGLIGRIWDSITGIFSLPEGGFLKSIKDRIFSIGRLVKAIGKAGVAAAKALLPGGDGPGEAFKKKFQEVMSGGQGGDVTNEGDTTNLSTDNTVGDTTTTTNNTKMINEAGGTGGEVTIVNNQTVEVNNSQSTSSNSINAVNLDTSTDGYWDRIKSWWD